MTDFLTEEESELVKRIVDCPIDEADRIMDGILANHPGWGPILDENGARIGIELKGFHG